jgi:hypothetical protein
MSSNPHRYHRPRQLCTAIFAASIAASTAAPAQVLFDFDGTSIGTPLPVDITQSGLTAHLSATGAGYSIQDPLQTILVLPVGFSGHGLSPSSVFLADLLVGFDVPLSEFSIMVAPQILACDTTATLRVTGYLGTTFVATATSSATSDPPYMWPSSTLSLTSQQAFDRLVVHYDAAPSGACDYGVIFVADNMTAVVNTIFANSFE